MTRAAAIPVAALVALAVASDVAAQRVNAGARFTLPSPSAIAGVRESELPAASGDGRRRSTRRGVAIGAIAGGGVGLVGGALLGLVARAVCEGDCRPERGALFVAETGLLGGIAGATAGALLGGIVGAAVPAEPEGAASEEPPTPGSTQEAIGRIALMPAVSISASGERGSGPAAAGAFIALLGRVELGLEGGVYGLGSRRSVFYPPCVAPGECADTLTISDYAWSAGSVLRVKALGGERLRPFAVVGAGVYSFRSRETAGVATSLELPGYSWGLGLEAALAGRAFGVAGEVRRHDNLRTGAGHGDLAFYTLGLGATYTW